MGKKRRVLREFSTTINDLSSEGAGVGRVDGKVWFVDGALPGEEVRFKELRGRKRHGRGTLIDIERESPERVTPPCPAFGVCGGCVLQHLEPTAQIKAKERRLLTEFEKLANLSPDEVMRPLTGDPAHYRRKARLGIRHVPKKGGVLVGFRERNSSFITPLSDCMTLRKEASVLLEDLPKLIESLSFPDRIPQIEIAVGDSVVSLVFRHLEPMCDIDNMTLIDWAQKRNVQVFCQPGGLDSVHCIWPTNPQTLSYALGDFGLTLEFDPLDFVQVNGDINERLITQVVTCLEPTETETVLDLFCGLGNFSLPIATRSRHVVGVEGSLELVEKAQSNAKLNKLGNLSFQQKNLHDEDIDLGFNDMTFDKILIDPPRSGALDVVKRIGAKPEKGQSTITPTRVVYVSCNPATLARDCEILVHENGFRLSKVGVVDMFPHTAHIESMAVLDAT